MRFARTLPIVLVSRLVASSAAAEDFPDWLEHVSNEAKAEVIAEKQAVADQAATEASVRAGVRSNRNQAEAPAASGNSTSLIDTSSASDLISAALNLAGLTAGTKDSSEADGTTGTVTGSGYVLYAAAARHDPLDPDVYCTTAARFARSFWVTLGFDDQEDDDSEQTENPIVVGGKVQIPFGRFPIGFQTDVCDWKTSEELRPLREELLVALENAADEFNIQSFVIERQLVEQGNQLPAAKRTALDAACGPGRLTATKVIDDTCFPALLTQLGSGSDSAVEKRARETIRENITASLQLDEAIRKNIEALQTLQRKSAAAITFTTKQRNGNGDGDGDDTSDDDTDVDEYSTGLVYEQGFRGLDFTLNGSHEYKDGPGGESSQGGRAAANIEFQPFADFRLAGSKPMRLNMGFEGKWQEDEKPLYKGQLKVNLPIPFVDFLSGLEVPLSVTVANRTDLIDETDVRGMIGFTLDTAQVLAEARRRFLSAVAAPPASAPAP